MVNYQAVDTWLQGTIKPLVDQKQYSQLSVTSLKGNPLFRQACVVYGKHKFDWKAVLSTLGLHPDEYKVYVSHQQKNLKEKVDTWLRDTIKPLVDSKDYAKLPVIEHKSNPLFRKACKLYGQHGFDWHSVLKRLGVTPEQYQKITSEAKSTIPLKEVDEWLSSEVTPLIQDKSWIQLSEKNFWKNKYFQKACTLYGNHKFDWAGVLRHLGIDNDQYRLIRSASNLEGRVLTSAAEMKEKKTQVDSWLEQEVKPLITQGNFQDLLPGRFIQNQNYDRALELYSDEGWRGVMSHLGADISLYDEAVRKSKSDMTRAFSDEEFNAWIVSSITPLISQGKWSELSMKKWKKDPHFFPACANFGKHHMDWKGFLKTLGITEEQYRDKINQKGKFSRK